MKMTYRVHDVCILVDCLRRKGIAALVWGEMAALAAYHGRIIPSRLYLIIPDNCFNEAKDTFLHELGMEEVTDFRISEKPALPLSAPYLRLKLQPVLSTPAYMQLFKASDVGLDDGAWKRCRLGHYRGGLLLVPSPSDFLEICAFLFRKFLLSFKFFETAQIESAIEYLQLFLYECFSCELFHPSSFLKVRQDLAPFSWWLCNGLTTGLKFKLAEFSRSNIRKPLDFWMTVS